jgi:hypothetical protein
LWVCPWDLTGWGDTEGRELAQHKAKYSSDTCFPWLFFSRTCSKVVGISTVAVGFLFWTFFLLFFCFCGLGSLLAELAVDVLESDDDDGDGAFFLFLCFWCFFCRP